MTPAYADFLASKKVDAPTVPVPFGQIHPALFPFQRKVAEFLLEKGRAAAFEDTGLGKTIVQCEWARHVPGKTLFLAPIGVAPQTIREAEKHLGMEILPSRDGTARGQYTITNYDLLHKFDPSQFEAVVLDESSILKSFTGATKQQLCTAFKDTRYKLACTATPAPNDYMEIGNHSQFLGVMDSTEMLTRWFINDQSQTGTYRLKGHAVASFWEWVGSWAACVSMPSDLGFPNDGYILPPLSIDTHTVASPLQQGGEGMLFDLPSVSATDLHATKRLTTEDRCQQVAALVNSSTATWIVWCESNEESTRLAHLIPDAVEVAGHHHPDLKEARMTAFGEGRARVIISKPSICGFGMNWQHCHHIAFASISYSYEAFYQAIRRAYRFGQLFPVKVHVFISSAELPVWRTIERKALDHDRMKHHMRLAARAAHTRHHEVKVAYAPTKPATLPRWLTESIAA